MRKSPDINRRSGMNVGSSQISPSDRSVIAIWQVVPATPPVQHATSLAQPTPPQGGHAGPVTRDCPLKFLREILALGSRCTKRLLVRCIAIEVEKDSRQ